MVTITTHIKSGLNFIIFFPEKSSCKIYNNLRDHFQSDSIDNQCVTKTGKCKLEMPFLRISWSKLTVQKCSQLQHIQSWE
jgi:hypothetical protein